MMGWMGGGGMMMMLAGRKRRLGVVGGLQTGIVDIHKDFRLSEYGTRGFLLISFLSLLWYDSV